MVLKTTDLPSGVTQSSTPKPHAVDMDYCVTIALFSGAGPCFIIRVKYASSFFFKDTLGVKHVSFFYSSSGQYLLNLNTRESIKKKKVMPPTYIYIYTFVLYSHIHSIIKK